jgi:hypothetical protein
LERHADSVARGVAGAGRSGIVIRLPSVCEEQCNSNIRRIGNFLLAGGDEARLDTEFSDQFDFRDPAIKRLEFNKIRKRVLAELGSELINFSAVTIRS